MAILPLTQITGPNMFSCENIIWEELNVPVVYVGAVALMDQDNRICITKRDETKHQGGKWEFPGGKIESGEAPEMCIVREVEEELGIDVGHYCLSPLTFVTHRYEECYIVLMLYQCRKWKGQVTAKEGQEIKWVPAKELSQYTMPEANKSLVAMIRDFI